MKALVCLAVYLILRRTLAIQNSKNLTGSGIENCYYESTAPESAQTDGTECTLGNCASNSSRDSWMAVDLLGRSKVNYVTVSSCNKDASQSEIKLSFVNRITNWTSTVPSDSFQLTFVLEANSTVHFNVSQRARYLYFELLEPPDESLKFKDVIVSGYACVVCNGDWHQSLDGSLCYHVSKDMTGMPSLLKKDTAENYCSNRNGAVIEPSSLNDIYSVSVTNLQFGINRTWLGLKIQNGELIYSNGSVVQSDSFLYTYLLPAGNGECVVMTFANNYFDLSSCNCYLNVHTNCEKPSTDICGTGTTPNINNIGTTAKDSTTATTSEDPFTTSSASEEFTDNTLSVTSSGDISPEITESSSLTITINTELITTSTLPENTDLKTTVSGNEGQTTLTSTLNPKTVTNTDSSLSGFNNTFTHTVISNTPQYGNVQSTSADDCLCPCLEHLTFEQQMALLEKITKALTLNKKELSSYRRSKQCAEDNRPSAKFTGAVGVVVLSFVFGVIIIFDVAGLFFGKTFM